MPTSITTINSTDLITNSRTDINNNFASLNANKLETNLLTTDSTLSADSDLLIPSQKAVKTYVDAGGNVNASITNKGIVQEATAAQVAAGTATGSTGARLYVNPSLVPQANYQVFTANGTWTKPSNVTANSLVLIQMWGAGGGGGGTGSFINGGTGGGGGLCLYIAILASLLTATEAITIGTPGAGGVGESNGSPGGNTSFGSLFTANGGLAGNQGNNGTPASSGSQTGFTATTLPVTSIINGGASLASSSSAGTAGAPAGGFSSPVTPGGGGAGGPSNSNGSIGLRGEVRVWTII